MVQIALIDYSAQMISKEHYSIDKLTDDFIRDEIKGNICFKNVENMDDLFGFIKEIIKDLKTIYNSDKEDSIDIIDCYYDSKYVYQLIGVEKALGDTREKNKLATQLAKKHQTIGRTILIKRRIEEKGNKLEYENILLSDVVNLVRKTIVKKGVKCFSSGIMKEIEYIEYPGEELGLQYLRDNLRYYEQGYFQNALIHFVDLKHSEEDLNPIISAIYGQPVRGTVFTGIRDNEGCNNLFIDLTSKDLLNMYYHSILDHDLTKYYQKMKIEEIQSDDELAKFPKTSKSPNIFQILEEEYKDINFNEIDNKPILKNIENKELLNCSDEYYNK